MKIANVGVLSKVQAGFFLHILLAKYARLAHRHPHLTPFVSLQLCKEYHNLP